MHHLRLLLVLLVFLPKLANSQVATTPDPDSAWFTPQLVVDNDQICSALHEDAIAKFLTASPLSDDYYIERDTAPDFLGMQALSLRDPTITPQAGEPPSLNINGAQVFLQNYTYPGCGGACESYQLLTSANSNFERADRDALPIPSPHGFQLYRDQAGTYWLVVLDGQDRRLHLYKVPSDGQWAVSCEVHFKPADLALVESVDLQPALQDIEQLRLRVLSILGGAGDCGSMQTRSRWINDLDRRLPELLYQPWTRTLVDPRSDSPYEHDLENLEDWALFGVSEFRTLQAYQEQLDKTVAALTEFYVQAYGWQQAESAQLAHAATTNTISDSIRFYDFGAFTENEKAVRHAILAGLPLAQIEALNFEFSEESTRANAEKIVSLAINSPEILQYILSQGGDPNNENAFGKTPLMYAAQYNNLEAARILLAAGANPNATTRRATDSCYYNLASTNMTPLHYAVRYASPDLIRLLLDEGAELFVNSQGRAGRSSALEWLRFYTGPASLEINANIPEQRIEEVAAWLEPPSAEAVAARTMSLILEAERLYQAGDTAAAFQVIGLALQADPANERALSNMSLIALRNGKLGPAFEASQRLIDGTYSDRIKANAWFNQGLGCEENERRSVRYNGNSYCGFGYLYSFQKAYSLNATDARKNKILQLFAGDTMSACTIPGANAQEIKINFETGTNPETYIRSNITVFSVLHDPAQEIEASFLTWNWRSRTEEMLVTPELIGRVELGERIISLFSSTVQPQFPFTFGSYVCETSDDPDATVTAPVVEPEARGRRL